MPIFELWMIQYPVVNVADLHLTSWICLFRPQSLWDREIASRKTLTIMGCIRRLNHNGWIEMENNFLHITVYTQDRNLHVQEGSHVRIDAVYPIYLWGTLRGFALSHDSICNVMSINDAMKPRDRSGYAMFGSHGPWSGCCCLYLAWLMATTRKLVKHISHKASHIQKILQLIEFKYMEPLTTTYSLNGRAHVTVDGATEQLVLVRAGHDNDWLSSQLVQIWTIDDIITYTSSFSPEMRSRGAASGGGTAMHNCTDMMRERFQHTDLCCMSNCVIVIGIIHKCTSIANSNTSSVMKCQLNTVGDVQNCHNGVQLIITEIEEDMTGLFSEFIGQLPSVGFVILLKNPSVIFDLGHATANMTTIACKSKDIIYTELQISLTSHHVSLPTPTLINQDAAGITNGDSNSAIIRNCAVKLTKHIMSVRELLYHFHHGSNSVSVIGVIIHKGLVLDASVTGKRVHNSQQKRKDQCCCVLRDTHHWDIFTVYLPINYEEQLVLGTIICISNCFLNIADGNRYVYGKVSRSSKNSIELMGMVDDYQLAFICNQSHCRPTFLRMSELSMKGYICPTTTIGKLVTDTHDNRCNWRLVVRIVSVKSIIVSYSGNICANKPRQWGAVTIEVLGVIDDGTSHCVACFEGDSGSALLSTLCDSAKSITELMAEIQEELKSTNSNRFVWSPPKPRKDMSTVSSSSSPLSSASMPMLSTVGKSLASIVAAHIQSAVMISLVVQKIEPKKNQSWSMHSIPVQQFNLNCKYSTSAVSIPTVCHQQLFVRAIMPKVMTSTDTLLEIRRHINALS